MSDRVELLEAQLGVVTEMYDRVHAERDELREACGDRLITGDFVKRDGTHTRFYVVTDEDETRRAEKADDDCVSVMKKCDKLRSALEMQRPRHSYKAYGVAYVYPQHKCEPECRACARNKALEISCG